MTDKDCAAPSAPGERRTRSAEAMTFVAVLFWQVLNGPPEGLGVEGVNPLSQFYFMNQNVVLNSALVAICVRLLIGGHTRTSLLMLHRTIAVVLLVTIAVFSRTLLQMPPFLGAFIELIFPFMLLHLMVGVPLLILLSLGGIIFLAGCGKTSPSVLMTDCYVFLLLACGAYIWFGTWAYKL